MPIPEPVNVQLSRSVLVAYSSRGYQEMGTDRLRPSFNSTSSVESVTATLVAVGGAKTVVEVFI